MRDTVEFRGDCGMLRRQRENRENSRSADELAIRGFVLTIRRDGVSLPERTR
jgi:hypothetical protein